MGPMYLERCCGRMPGGGRCHLPKQRDNVCTLSHQLAVRQQTQSPKVVTEGSSPSGNPQGWWDPSCPAPDLQGKDSSAVLGQILAIIPLQELICQPGCSLCCSPIAAELGGGMAVLSPCTIPWDPCVPVGMLGWGGRGGGTKGLTRGSLLPLRRDLNQTERFCHPSH